MKAPIKPRAAPKPTKAAAKPKATTVRAPAKKAAPKKKILADHDDNAEESEMDVDASDASDDDDAGPSAPREKLATNGKKKTASETYTKVRIEASRDD